MADTSNTDVFGVIIKDVNPDLDRERKAASFNIQELTHIIDGGPHKTRRRKDIEKLLYSDPLFCDMRRLSMERDEIYEQAVLKGVKLFKWAKQYQWSEEDFEIASRLANHDIALSLHYIMFVPAIERLASAEQKAKWLPSALSYEWIGTYAQTELGHGTNLLELETVATYDQETDEFVLNSPKITSMKWWPGSLGKSSNIAIVLGHLVVKGKKCGLQAFLVPIRSVDDHMPLPGITVGDIGPKLALDNNDNGFLIMKNVRIPRENMLMKNAEVTRDGRFISHGVDKANYITMMLVRVKVAKLAFECLCDGATTAVRYSVVRRQTTLKPGTREEQVMNFQSQQYKVLPALAAAYAFLFGNRRLETDYKQAQADMMAGNAKLMGELHCQTSAVKAFTTEMCIPMLELCRQSCGGHGYLQSGGIGVLLNSALPLVTVEGENSVLYQQVARFLMKQLARKVGGEAVSGIVQYLEQPFEHQELRSVADCLNLDTLHQLYVNATCSVVTSTAQQLQRSMEQGLEQHMAWNSNMVSLIRAAKMHGALYVVEAFKEGVRRLGETASANLTAVMTAVCQFYTLHGIVMEAGAFLGTATINPDEFELIRAAEVQVMAVVRADAVPLVDAFDFDDIALHSALGCYDGNVYERLYALAQTSTLNKTQVHPAYHKHLRGLIKEGQRQRKQSKL